MGVYIVFSKTMVITLIFKVNERLLQKQSYSRRGVTSMRRIETPRPVAVQFIVSYTYFQSTWDKSARAD